MQESSCLQRGRRGPWQRRFFYGRRTSARGGPQEGSSGGLELPLRCSIGVPPLCRQLLSYITKDKQTESLLEKLCQRFRTARYAAFLGGGGFFVLRGALQGQEEMLGEHGPLLPVPPTAPHKAFPICRTERQYRDLAYCVSQLPFTERGLRKMLDNFDCFGDKLSDESIFSVFLSVVSKLRRGAKPEGKVSSTCSVGPIQVHAARSPEAPEVTHILPHLAPA